MITVRLDRVRVGIWLHVGGPSGEHDRDYKRWWRKGLLAMPITVLTLEIKMVNVDISAAYLSTLSMLTKSPCFVPASSCFCGLSVGKSVNHSRIIPQKEGILLAR